MAANQEDVTDATVTPIDAKKRHPMANKAHDREVVQAWVELEEKKKLKQELNSEINALRKSIYDKGHDRLSESVIEKLRQMTPQQVSAFMASLAHFMRASGMAEARSLFESVPREATSAGPADK